jgi:ADP-ribose pyrophosphatase
MAADDEPDSRPPRRAAHKDAHLVERRIDSERVFAGSLLDVRRDRVRLPDGHEATREYIVHPGAVLIVPRLDDGRLVVARQFRYPNNAVFIEFPAGKLDPGEAALATAKRELKEEAGYTATTWTHLGRIHPVVSYSTETIELYLAQGLAHVGATLDDGEFLEIDAMQYEAIVAAADRGEITDAKTIATLYHLERRRRHDATRTCRLIISGRVQGVGFRDGMIGVALEAGVSGWVRNRRDGSVEVLVQGDPPSVDKLIDWSRHGPRAARVTSVEVTTEPQDLSLDGFDVRATA